MPFKRSRRDWPWLVAAFALCFFAGGASWWRGSYEEYLEKDFVPGMLLLLGGAALFLTWVADTGIIASAVTVAGSFPAIILVRVVLDGTQDPTSHNLWPFEVVLGFGFAMGVTLLFAGWGALIHRLMHRNRS
jgi:hypothetical protein